MRRLEKCTKRGEALKVFFGKMFLHRNADMLLDKTFFLKIMADDDMVHNAMCIHKNSYEKVPLS